MKIKYFFEFLINYKYNEIKEFLFIINLNHPFGLSSDKY